MITPRLAVLTAIIGLVATVAAAAWPGRPGPDTGRNFYLLAGAESLDYRLDPRGADGFAAAGLDLERADGQGVLGVGWVFAYPVRLDLTLAGGQALVSRPGVDCAIVRIGADLHLAVYETRAVSCEGTLTLALHAIGYRGLPNDEFLPGGEVGLGATVRLGLVGPFGLMTTYRWEQTRFQRTNVELDDGSVLRVHPTAAFHSVRVVLTWDL
ncbi:MAG: hypothetical protein R3D98_13695 [Candidatus Krumholzibacteriia bacterium]